MVLVKSYPTVNRPTIRVPAIVAWQMGMTSCNSASNTLVGYQFLGLQYGVAA